MALVVTVASAGALGASEASDAEFFESRIRPVLVEKCFACHSRTAEKIRSGLRLDGRSALLAGGDRGPAIHLEKPEDSLLLKALRYETENLEMPPKGKLPARVIADFEEWIRRGAPWPGSTENDAAPVRGGSYDWDQATEHWAFRPVSRPATPPVRDAAWPQTPIDSFVLAKLEGAGLTPGVEASRRTLIRRLYLDLLGVPPSAEATRRFADDPREDAYDRLVDRVLASPAYGERQARHWLDLARYNDGFGSGFDGNDKPHAWRYRDWVVESLNSDLPYDEFAKRQIAGDLIEPRDLRATGFLAIGPTYKSDGGDPEAIAKARADTLEDRLDTTFRTFLGLTIACARCHDHKFDPIPTEDYYSLAGVFNNTRESDRPLASDEEVRRVQEHQSRVKELSKQIKDREKAIREGKEAATEEQSKTQLASLRAELDSLKSNAPPPYGVTHAVSDSGSNDMPIALRGDLRKKGPIAPRRFLRVLEGEERSHWAEGSGRLQLARALASKTNPLTSRVIANRVWLGHFGHGLIRTPSNFGVLGEAPSHPELLDWLASELIDGGWSLKRLHAKIVRSATYRMSTEYRAGPDAKDGDNRLFWRRSPRRLEVEAWRDSILAATGELDLTMGGASIRDLLASRRRTVYSVISRNGDRFDSDRFLRLFDFPAARLTAPERAVSTVPQQALFLLNSPFMIARAEALAKRMEAESTDPRERIEYAYDRLFGREPTTRELELALAFLSAENAAISSWAQYAQVLLGSHELFELP